MYMYTQGLVKCGDGSEQWFGEEDGLGSVDAVVSNVAYEYIREDPERTFTIDGTLITDYSDLRFYIEYDGTVCTVSETDYYWDYSDDNAWYGESSDRLANFCEYYGIQQTDRKYAELRDAYEKNGTYIYSNDARTKFYTEVPFTNKYTVYENGEFLQADEVTNAILGMLEDGLSIDDIMNEVICDVPVSEMYTEEELRQLAEENGYEIVESYDDE